MEQLFDLFVLAALGALAWRTRKQPHRHPLEKHDHALPNHDHLQELLAHDHSLPEHEHEHTHPALRRPAQPKVQPSPALGRQATFTRRRPRWVGGSPRPPKG